MHCSTATGTWRERLGRLQDHTVRARFGTIGEMTNLLADAEKIVHEANGTMTRSEQIDLSNALGFLMEGFARLANHCDEARRTRALALYDPPVMTPALQACLTSTNP